jgi:hypothetical protein
MGLWAMGVCNPTPLLLHLAVQVYICAMVGRNSTVCSAPLMTHPLTTKRLRWLVGWLGALTALGEPASVCVCGGGG